MVTNIKTLSRFKPAYNPYTEPSMEIFSFHKGIHIMYRYIYVGFLKVQVWIFPKNILPTSLSSLSWSGFLGNPCMYQNMPY